MCLLSLNHFKRLLKIANGKTMTLCWTFQLEVRGPHIFKYSYVCTSVVNLASYRYTFLSTCHPIEWLVEEWPLGVAAWSARLVGWLTV